MKADRAVHVLNVRLRVASHWVHGSLRGNYPNERCQSGSRSRARCKLLQRHGVTFLSCARFPAIESFTGSKEFAGSPPNVPPVTIVPHRRWNCWPTRIIVPIADGCANL